MTMLIMLARYRALMPKILVVLIYIRVVHISSILEKVGWRYVFPLYWSKKHPRSFFTKIGCDLGVAHRIRKIAKTENFTFFGTFSLITLLFSNKMAWNLIYEFLIGMPTRIQYRNCDWYAQKWSFLVRKCIILSIFGPEPYLCHIEHNVCIVLTRPKSIQF